MMVDIVGSSGCCGSGQFSVILSSAKFSLGCKTGCTSQIRCRHAPDTSRLGETIQPPIFKMEQLLWHWKLWYQHQHIYIYTLPRHLARCFGKLFGKQVFGKQFFKLISMASTPDDDNKTLVLWSIYYFFCGKHVVAWHERQKTKHSRVSPPQLHVGRIFQPRSKEKEAT